MPMLYEETTEKIQVTCRTWRGKMNRQHSV